MNISHHFHNLKQKKKNVMMNKAMKIKKMILSHPRIRQVQQNHLSVVVVLVQLIGMIRMIRMVIVVAKAMVMVIIEITTRM